MTDPEKAILVVEDHDSVRGSLLYWLKSAFPEYLLLEAKTGEEGLEIALEKQPDLVLMDIGLPGASGIEICRQIKMSIPEVKVVMLTIHEDPVYMSDAESAGASAYVTKRKMAVELIPVLKRLLTNTSEKPPGG